SAPPGRRPETLRASGPASPPSPLVPARGRPATARAGGARSPPSSVALKSSGTRARRQRRPAPPRARVTSCFPCVSPWPPPRRTIMASSGVSSEILGRESLFDTEEYQIVLYALKLVANRHDLALARSLIASI